MEDVEDFQYHTEAPVMFEIEGSSRDHLNGDERFDFMFGHTNCG